MISNNLRVNIDISLEDFLERSGVRHAMLVLSDGSTVYYHPDSEGTASPSVLDVAKEPTYVFVPRTPQRAPGEVRRSSPKRYDWSEFDFSELLAMEAGDTTVYPLEGNEEDRIAFQKAVSWRVRKAFGAHSGTHMDRASATLTAYRNA